MLLSDFEYARPASLEEALELLMAYPDAQVLAGGQTLLNVMKLRISADQIVDIGRIDELQGISPAGEGSITLGAMSTYAQMVESADVQATRPILAEVAGLIADTQVRNRGTIGGNVCLNLSTSHFPPLLAALGATMRIVGRDGARDVSAEKFFLGPFTTAVGPGELLTSVTVPAPRPGQGDAFAAVGVGREGMGIVHAAASVRVNSTIQDAGLVLGCVAPAPVRASDVEAALRGSEPTESAVHDSVQGLGQTLNPGSDVNASDEYRRFASEVLAERAIKQAIERGRARCG